MTPKRLSVLLAASLLAGTVQAQAVDTLARDLIQPIVGAKDPQPLGIRRSRPVRVNVDLLKHARPGHRIRIAMFEGAVFVAKLTELDVEPHVESSFHWRGELVGRPGSTFVLTVHENAFAGWIFPNDPKFQSLCIQGAPGMYVARELDDAKHEGSVIVPKRTSVNPGSFCNDDKNRIEVLLVYGIGARSDAGGDTKARAACLNALAQANTCMSRSAITARFIAKYVSLVGYLTSGNQSTDLGRLRGTSDGHMDNVHTLRRTHSADLVAYIRRGSGGIAYCKSNYTNGFSTNGYNSLGSMVLAHELGHNLGCGHDPANAGSCAKTSYAYGHNFLYEEIGFPTYVRKYAYTVMSYSSKWGSCGFPWTCQKTRQPNYSSPLRKLSHKGKLFPTGTATRDNARSIRFHAQCVANHSVYVTGRHQKPVVRTHPINATRCYGDNSASPVVMSCRINAYGNTPRYQWRKNGVNVSGQTSSSLQILNLSSSHAGRYDCVITTCAGSVTTRSATLTLNPACRIRKHTAPTTGAGFGNHLGVIGDLDGDGYTDYGVGHPKGWTNGGWVELFSGRTQNRITFWRTSGSSNPREQGYAFAGGDTDDDGLAEAFVGAPAWSAGRGYVQVYNRRTRRIGTAFVGSVPGQRVGTALAAAQLDDDSRVDLLAVGSDTIYARTSKNWGKLWTVVPVKGVTVNSISTIGDVNGDGSDDFVIGLPMAAAGKGRVEVRSGRDGKFIHGWTSVNVSRMGNSVAGIGDVTGDGIPDYAYGAPLRNNFNGIVRIAYGHTGNTFAWRHGSVGIRLGYRVAAGGDINGDGVPDVLVAATSSSRNGSVSAFSGKSLATTLWSRSGSSSRYGFALAGGDFNGDGKGDALIGEQDRGVWVHDALPKASPPRFSTFGSICPDSQGRFTRIGAEPPARVGRTSFWTVRAKPNTPILFELGITRQNVDLTGIGMTGCRWHVVPIWLFPMATDAAGYAQFPFPVPNRTGFTGTKWIGQWFPIDRGLKTPLEIAASNGGEVRVGAR